MKLFLATTAAAISISLLANDRPNILFIITDDHAVQAFGTSAGDSPVPFPNFRRLANEGMVFDRSYCGNSLCGPSRATIYTGRHSHRNAYLYNGGPAFDGSQPTFPKILQAAGYQTALIGKWHLDSKPTGFDHWEIFWNQGEYYNPDYFDLPAGADGNGAAYSSWRRKRVPGYSTDITTSKALDWLDNRDKAKPFALVVAHKAPHRPWLPAPRHLGKAKEYLAALEPPATFFDEYANRPASMLLNEQTISHHFAVWSDEHILPPEFFTDPANKDLLRDDLGTDDFTPYIADREVCQTVEIPGYLWRLGELQRMDRAQKTEWVRYHAARTRDLIERVKSGELKDPEKLAVWRWRTYLEDYLGTIMAVDESIGTILDYLDAHSLSRDTLVVYCGDQGFYTGEHGMYDKRWILEESFRMPLVMRWPGRIKAGTRSTAMVQNIDYGPTFCHLAGLDEEAKKAGMQGRDLSPLFTTGTDDAFEDRPLYYAFYENPGEHNAPRHDGLRTSRWTFARFAKNRNWPQGKPFTFSDEWLLIDNAADPLQLVNRAADPDYKTVFESLKSLYETERARYLVPDWLPQGDLRNVKPAWIE
ncbi:MAG: sulfatase [Kiritimatiellae bacterium]|nr:sulfatase [Kiritimatiellia bacterium]